MIIQRLASPILGLALMAGPLTLSGGVIAGETGAPLDFELSDRQAFIRLSAMPPAVTVINFWRSDCPPCLREMPLLAERARQGKARVITVALQRPHETAAAPAAILNALGPPLNALEGPSDPRGILSRFGDPAGALPYTVVLDAQRRTCARHIGEVASDWLDAAIQRCALI